MTQTDNQGTGGQPRQQAVAVEDRGSSLRADERRFRREFGRMPCGMLVASLAEGQPCCYLAASDAYCRLAGYTWAELEGQDFLGDIHPEDQVALDTLIQGLVSGDTDDITATTRLIRKDGMAVHVRITGSAIRPAHGERYLTAFAEDITAVEQAKAETLQLQLELARSRRLESVGHLMSGIAHDFNNLLTVISSYASLVHEEVSVASAAESLTRWEPVRRDVEQIQGAVGRAKMVIQSMLAFARRVPSQPADLDLNQVIEDASHLLGKLLGEHIAIAVQPGHGVWPVMADPAMLEQVIANIAVNARDAMPDGGHLTIGVANIDTTAAAVGDVPVSERDREELAGLLPGPYVALRIADTGTGMDASTAARAFEPFFTTNGGGLAAGLGLTAVQRIATQAGGKAWLQSEPGAGTTVTVMLPAAHARGYEVTGPTAGPADQGGARPGSVLVVDDDQQLRTVIHRVLSSAGYRVATAASGQDALTLLEEQGLAADLLLTDVVMPGIAGNAFVARIQALRPRIQVLFMSGYERPDVSQEGWPEGGLPLIAKPFSRSALLTTVGQMIAAEPGHG